MPGIDLHGANSVIVVLDEHDRVLFQQRLRNDLTGILAAFTPFRETFAGIARDLPFNHLLSASWQGTSDHATMGAGSCLNGL